MSRRLDSLRLRLRSLFRRHSADEELDEELRFHIERQIEQNIAAGFPAVEAHRKALREFGGVSQTKDECRDTRGFAHIESGWRDILYCFRTLTNSPGFAAIIIITLALGIGAATAIFSVTNAVLLRPLLYRDSDRLVLAWLDFYKSSMSDAPFSNAEFNDLRDGTQDVFEEMSSIMVFRAIVPREGGAAERISKAHVTTNFFSMMGARVALGHDFTTADGQPRAAQEEYVFPPPRAT